MEGHGSGGKELVLEPRISRLEAGYETQANELRHLGQQVSGVKADIASVAAGQASMASSLSDIAQKLDESRTRRPDLQALIAGVSLFIVIASLALTPLYVQQNRLINNIAKLDDQLAQRAELDASLTGRYSADRDAILNRLERLEDKVDRHNEIEVEQAHK